MNDKIAVWTQAYNSEKTIKRAMESVLNQSYENIEYHVMDNGSTDNTYNIIKEYAQKDSRIIPYRLERNSIIYNEPKEHNLILSNIIFRSNVKWLVWCDSDDNYNENSFKNMVSLSKKRNADLILSGFSMIDSNNETIIMSRKLNSELLLKRNNYSKNFQKYRPFVGGLWGKLIPMMYLREIVKDYSKEENPKNTQYLWIDCMISLGVIECSERFAILPEVTYNWWQYENSLSNIVSDMQIERINEYWQSNWEHLKKLGEIDLITKDYMYAIYLSLIDEFLINLENNKSSTLDEKINLLNKLLIEEEVSKLFERKVDPQFKNLATRVSYLEKLKDKTQKDYTEIKGSEVYKDVIRRLDELKERAEKNC